MPSLSLKNYFTIALLIGFSVRLPAPVGDLPELKKLPVPEEQGPRPSKDDINTKGALENDIKRFGEEVAGRIDRVIKKKGFELWGDPWTVQGIPLIVPSAETGLNLGLHAVINNIRRQDPHKLEVAAQVMASDRGRYKHFFKIDYPHLWESYRFTARASYNRDINFKYYGIGNETTVDKAALLNDTALYKNNRTGPSFSIRFLKKFGKHFLFGPIGGLKWTDVESPPGSLLGSQNPVGSTGGKTHYVGFSFVYETLDFEPYPREGSFTELYVSRYASWTGSSFDFWRTTFTYRHYIPLHPKLIFAYRALIESLIGSVPFFELGSVGGSDSTIGFGGDRFMRGYDGNRFIDHIRLILGFELRWDPLIFSFANQDLTLGFVPFIDFGKVYSKLFPFFTGTIHASTGWGARLIWNKRFIIRTDFAVNQEGTSLYFELGNSF